MVPRLSSLNHPHIKTEEDGKDRKIREEEKIKEGKVSKNKNKNNKHN